MNNWFKANFLQVLTLVVGLGLIAGQWQTRQVVSQSAQEATERRVQALEQKHLEEALRLDGVYQRRDVSDAQYAEILRRLSTIERKLDNVR